MIDDGFSKFNWLEINLPNARCTKELVILGEFEQVKCSVFFQYFFLISAQNILHLWAFRNIIALFRHAGMELICGRPTIYIYIVSGEMVV